VRDRPLVHRDDAFRCGWTITQGAVWPDRVVVAAPVFDEYLGLAQRVEDLAVEEFVTEPALSHRSAALHPQSAFLAPATPQSAAASIRSLRVCLVFLPFSDPPKMGYSYPSWWTTSRGALQHPKASSQWTRDRSCTNIQLGPLDGGSPLKSNQPMICFLFRTSESDLLKYLNNLNWVHTLARARHDNNKS
jgi:hypothetical protein